jgi:HEAT repeat protein
MSKHHAAVLQHFLQTVCSHKEKFPMDTDAIQTIITYIHSSDEVVRYETIKCLAWWSKTDDPRLGQVLMSMLNDPVLMVRGDALETLGYIQYEPAIEAIREHLHHDPDWYVRASAAEALGCFPEFATMLLEDLYQALDDEESSVQMYAAEAIGYIAGPESLPMLQRAMKAADAWGAKIALIAACYRLGDLDSLRHLIFLLQEVTDPFGDDTHFVLQAIENLATFKTPARLFSDVPSLLEPLQKY